MKQRITFARKKDVGFKKSQIQVQENSVTVVSLSGSKEHRLTVGFDELPRELVRALEQCHELRIRWVSPRIHAPTSPFVSRLPPGLHVHVTPRTDNSLDLLCSSLKDLFSPELKCTSFQESFIPVPVLSTRFSTSASTQYYAPLESLAYLVVFLQQQVCSPADIACQDVVFSLLSASSLDTDFDAISRVLIVSALWDQPTDESLWNEKIEKRKNDRIEVGVLVEEPAEEAGELKLGGWLTVVGEDARPGTTLFSFPSRHHSGFAAQFRASLDEPASLHPTLRLSFQESLPLEPPSPSCALHAYLTIPSWLYLDQYVFTDPLFLSANNLTALHTLAGAMDLEAPDWAVQQWGSAALFELQSTRTKPGLEATIPLHMRYLAPAAGGYANISLPWPAVFWACPVPQGSGDYEGPKMDTNPFDRTNIGWDGLFGERTLFHHLQPLSDQDWLYETMAVPVLDLGSSSYVETGTVVAIVLGLCWVSWTLFKPLHRKTKQRLGKR